MATYKITGARFLRKYTAKNLSPAYAAALDAQTVVDEFCNIPWEAVEPKTSQFAYHTEEVVNKETGRSGLDENVAIRDSLDAALFCAEHAAGMHRAYAQAMCLRFTLPDDAVGTSLTSLKLKVSSDPYNSGGCRVSAFTNSSGEIPMNCNTVRTGAVHAEAQVPRTSQTSSGTTYWYAVQGTVTLTPESAITLQKYLFVFFGLEDYSITRGNWLEGSATLKNLVEITTSAAVTGWTDGETYDLSSPPNSLVSLDIVDKAGGAVYMKRGRLVLKVVGDDSNVFLSTDDATGSDHSKASAGDASYPANKLLARFACGELQADDGAGLNAYVFAPGVDSGDYPDDYQRMRTCLAFDLCAHRIPVESPGDRQWSDTYEYSLLTGVAFLPLFLPQGFRPQSLSLDIATEWTDGRLLQPPHDPPADTSIIPARRANRKYTYNLWLKEGHICDIGELYKKPQLYQAGVAELDGWRLLGSIAPVRRWDSTPGQYGNFYSLIDALTVNIGGKLTAPVSTLLIAVNYDLSTIEYDQLFAPYFDDQTSTDLFGQGYLGDGMIRKLTLSV